MSEVFADTFYFLALHNPADRAHEVAVAATDRLPGPLVTTAWVLTEFADALADGPNRAACVAFIEDLRNNPEVTLVAPTSGLFESGWALYCQRTDKEWSLTDCISFVVMRERNITEALTGDRHFEQAGFSALLRQGVRR